ncbi:hypothetical protein A1OE_1527 [Candidatus Endolissoclinum faulkneri L2]|uniref:Uncharacterized protein n=1 Tax=Candidatus Endolissoclinum faulkneri L2 TaxID=1193729 RepID=K7YJ71_9PROT|nr:hypothetical protein A1OE_1527 [Candidatus Endolissoclinum faulkneri L2]
MHKPVLAIYTYMDDVVYDCLSLFVYLPNNFQSTPKIIGYNISNRDCTDMLD